MQTYNVSRLPSMIKIGFDGENNWRPQAFDCTPLLQNHPTGTITLWLLPDGETQAYPVALERDRNTVVWTPLSEEMTARTGALQIVCTDGTDVGKSRVALFRVDSSILPGANHPASVPSWATQTVERAEDAADRAEAAVSHYSRIQNGTWWVWDVANSEWVDTGVSAQGPAGDTGESAYEEAVALGFVGTEAEWLASLHGKDGNCNFATFEIDPTTGILSATYTTDDSGISFEINSAKHLEVVIQ